MKWQLRVQTQLNLDDLSPKVISDYTGILSTEVFLASLNRNCTSYLVTDKIPEMLTAAKSKVQLIITTREVPAFVQKEVTLKTFTFSEIPLNGEIGSLLKHRSASEIVNLLNFVYATNPHLVITKHNIENLFEQSRTFQYQCGLNNVLTDVTELLQQKHNIESLLKLGALWGKVVYLSAKVHSLEYMKLLTEVDAFAKQFFLDGQMEEAFYASTAKIPKTVDRILPHLKGQSEKKVSLICFDCMGFAEWYILKEYLNQTKLTFIETPLFAMLPSITKYSRSAIFHGSREVYNIKSPGRSDEAKAFASYFLDKQTRYFTQDDFIDNDRLLGYEYISILYSFFDDLSHSAQFPPNEETKELYFKAVFSYLQKTDLIRTLQTLEANNFTVYFCSDHGSVVARGNGQRFEKYLLDNFAKRAITIPELSKGFVDVELLPVPFQSELSIALPHGRSMFANKNQIEINHGGITVEEMVVPFIKVEQ